MPNTTTKGVNNTMNTKINPATIQDESGILRFKLENHEYSLNVNIEEERERIKEEVNSRSKHYMTGSKRTLAMSIGFFMTQKCTQ